MDDLTIKKAAIKKQACFSQLTEKEVENLTELLVPKHAKAGEIIVKEGDPVDSVYLIIKGTAQVKRNIVKDGTVHTENIATLGVGDAIGLNETGFYSISGRRTATVAAITEMLLLRLSVVAFRGFALAYPHINQVMRENAGTFIKKV